MKNVIIRSLSGIVYIILIVGAIIAGDWWFYALTLLFTALATREYHSLVSSHLGYCLPGAVTAVDYLGATLMWSIIPLSMYSGLPTIDMMIVMMGMIAVLILGYILTRMSLSVLYDGTNPIADLGASLCGLIYIALPMSILNFIMASLGSDFASRLLLLMFIMIWVNDTGAFCVGTLFGKHRLCERLSPKKSWEGFWGGMTFCLMAGIGYAIIYDENVIVWAFYGCLVSVFATIGDLFESMLKRRAGVKDSGNLIPGHGGILDRIDSLLFVAPLTLIYLAIVMFLGL